MLDLKNVNVLEDIRNIVAEIIEIDAKDVADDAQFVKDLGMDSMMALEILAGIEKKYRIVVPEEALPKFISLSATVSIVKDIITNKK